MEATWALAALVGWGYGWVTTGPPYSCNITSHSTSSSNSSNKQQQQQQAAAATTVSAVRSEACASAHRQRLQQRRNGNSFLLMAKWDPGESAPFRAPSESPLERELKGIGSELR